MSAEIKDTAESGLAGNALTAVHSVTGEREVLLYGLADVVKNKMIGK